MTTLSQSNIPAHEDVELLASLTDLERELVRSARRGTVVDCGPSPMDELAVTQDPCRIIRAELIRELLLGRRGELDPNGVRIIGVRVTGELDLSYVHTRAVLNVAKSVFDGPCALGYAYLPHLALEGSHLVGLDAVGLRVDGNVLLHQGFRVAGASEDGAMRLVGAHIQGDLYLDNAELINSAGPALNATDLRVSQSLLLRGRFRAKGTGEQATVRLVGARIGGGLLMDGAELTNTAGPALVADGLQVGDVTFLRDGFTATGTGGLGTVRLRRAHIGTKLSMRNAAIHKPDKGLVLDLEGTTVGSLLLSPNSVCADGAMAVSPCPNADRLIRTSHLAYDAFEGASWQQWLHLLRHHSRTYNAQPYQQLATVERACGHDGPARRVLIAQQDDLRHRGNIGGWRTRLMHWAWGKVAGYGYRTSRLITALVLAIMAAAALGLLAGHVPIRDGRYVAAHTKDAEHPHTPCSLIEQIGLGIDRGLPLGTTGLRQRCDLDTTSRRGQAITLAVWAVQALVWALATLAVAGYTGLIRKIT